MVSSNAYSLDFVRFENWENGKSGYCAKAYNKAPYKSKSSFYGKIKIKFSLKTVSATFLLVCFVCLKESTLEARKKIIFCHIESPICSWDNEI